MTLNTVIRTSDAIFAFSRYVVFSSFSEKKKKIEVILSLTFVDERSMVKLRRKKERKHDVKYVIRTSDAIVAFSRYVVFGKFKKKN